VEVDVSYTVADGLSVPRIGQKVAEVWASFCLTGMSFIADTLTSTFAVPQSYEIASQYVDDVGEEYLVMCLSIVNLLHLHTAVVVPQVESTGL